jgi:uncharacterized protein (DUF4415 family)
MKSGSLPKGFPASPEEWEKLIAEAPGEDRPPTPEEAAAWSNAIVSHSLPELQQKLGERRRSRGHQQAPLKVPITLRLDPDVLAGLKATGKGWQTRVNAALREWLKAQSA